MVPRLNSLRALPLVALLLASLPVGPALLHRPAAAGGAAATASAGGAPLPGEIRLLVWNMGKTGFGGLEALFADRRPTLVCLQEAGSPPEGLEGYHTSFTSNLRLEGRGYGPAVLSRERPEQVWRFAGRDREPLTGTRKAILAVRLRGDDPGGSPGAGPLLVVDVHALNFRGMLAYRRQLNGLAPLLQAHRGPLIVCGDFNAWTLNRDRFLAKWSARFGLTRIDFGRQTGRIRRFLGSPPFDRVYVRGLQAREGTAEVIPDKEGSDHAPLFVVLIPRT